MKPFFVVLGLPRGGTSSVAMVVDKLGASGRLAPHPRIDGLAKYPVYEDPILVAMMTAIRGTKPAQHLRMLEYYIQLRRMQEPGKALSCKHPWLCDLGGCPRKTAAFFKQKNVQWIRAVRPLEDVLDSMRNKYPARILKERIAEAHRFHESLDRLEEHCPPLCRVSFAELLADPGRVVSQVKDCTGLAGDVQKAVGLVHKGSSEPNTIRERPANWREEA